MRFVCDAMLGKLAKYLRIFGLDTVYARSASEFERYMAPDEAVNSCIFTRRLHIAHDDRIVFVRSDKPKDQLREVWPVVAFYVNPSDIMGRCIRCNERLADSPKADVEPYIPEYVFHKYERFRRCPACGKVYWEGSHAAHMSQFIEEVSFGRTAK